MTSQSNNSKKDLKKMRHSGPQVGKHLIKAVTAAAFLGLAFWLLWNWVGVPLFTFPSLTYWQALGAIMMTGFLLRIFMVAAGRHRGHHFKRPVYAGCPISRNR